MDERTMSMWRLSFRLLPLPHMRPLNMTSQLGTLLPRISTPQGYRGAASIEGVATHSLLPHLCYARRCEGT